MRLVVLTAVGASSHCLLLGARKEQVPQQCTRIVKIAIKNISIAISRNAAYALAAICEALMHVVFLAMFSGVVL